MAGGYDGAIRIDTRINESGFNKGVGKVGAALKGMMAKITTGLAIVSLAALGVVAVIASIATALISAGIVAFKFLEKVTMDMYRALSPASAYYDKVSTLKAAFDSLNGSVQGMFSSLLTTATPVLMKVIDWLIKIINLVSMILAALAGQKTYMKYVSGAAQQSARSTGKSAKNTKDMEKAARGALAAWDELNVLQKQQAEEDPNSGGGGGFSGGNIMFEETPIENGVLTTVEKIKKWFVDAWTFIKTKFLEGADWIAENIVGPISDWFIRAWEWIKQAASDAWDFIINVVFARAWGFLVSFYEFITGIWQAIHDWIVAKFQEAWEKTMVNIANFVLFINKFRDKITEIWQAIRDWIIAKFKEAWDKTVENIETMKTKFGEFKERLTEIWQAIRDWIIAKFKEAWDKTVENIETMKTKFGEFKERLTEIFQNIRDWIVEKFQNAKDKVTEIWATVSTWFTENVMDPLKKTWTTLTDWLKETWDTIWNGEGGVKSIVKGAINVIIDFINTMIRAIAGGINTVIRGLNSISVTVPGWAAKLLKIEEGSVWGFNLKEISAPQIPQLAKGAVIPPNAEFAAILGDQKNGRNIETPEALLRQIVQEELDRAGGDTNVTMPVYLDGEKIYEGQQRISRRRGRSLAFGGA